MAKQTEEQTTTPTTEPAANDAFDSHINQLMDDVAEGEQPTHPAQTQQDSEDKPTERPRDEKGRFAPKQQQDDSEEEEATKTTDADDSHTAEQADEADGDDSDTPEKPSHPDYSDDELRTAVKALQRDKAPKWMLDKLTDGDAETIAHGLHRHKVQQDIDSKFDEHSQTRRELEELRRESTGQRDSDSARDGKDADTATGDVDITPLATALAEEIGIDVNGPLQETLRGVESKLRSQYDSKLSAVEQQLEAVHLDRARDTLVSEYPDLKDKEVWQRVLKQFKDLPANESRPDVATRLDHAARIELGPEMARRAAEQRRQRNKARDSGSPTTQTRSETPAPATPENRFDLMIDAGLKGDDATFEKLKNSHQ